MLTVFHNNPYHIFMARKYLKGLLTKVCLLFSISFRLRCFSFLIAMFASMVSMLLAKYFMDDIRHVGQNHGLNYSDLVVF